MLTAHENVSKCVKQLVKYHLHITFFHTSRLLTNLKKMYFGNIVKKGEYAGKQHFFPFPTMISYILSKTLANLLATFDLSSVDPFVTLL